MKADLAGRVGLPGGTDGLLGLQAVHPSCGGGTAVEVYTGGIGCGTLATSLLGVADSGSFLSLVAAVSMLIQVCWDMKADLAGQMGRQSVQMRWLDGSWYPSNLTGIAEEGTLPLGVAAVLQE